MESDNRQEQRFVAIDLETTGLMYAQDRIVSVGMVEIIGNIVGREFYAEVNPELTVIPAPSQAVHGLSAEYLRDKPTFASVASEIMEFIGDSVLLIHNANFDFLFLETELRRARWRGELHNKFICTQQLSRRTLPLAGGRSSLDRVSKFFGLQRTSQNHNALEDARLVAQIYLFLRLNQGENKPRGDIASAILSDRVSARELNEAMLAKGSDRSTHKDSAARKHFLVRLPDWVRDR